MNAPIPNFPDHPAFAATGLGLAVSKDRRPRMMPDQPSSENFTPPTVDARSRLDRALDGVAKSLGMCGHGPDLNWWVRVAETFFVDCACCIFWRGVAVGAIGAVAFCAAAVALGLVLATGFKL